MPLKKARFHIYSDNKFKIEVNSSEFEALKGIKFTATYF